MIKTNVQVMAGGAKSYLKKVSRALKWSTAFSLNAMAIEAQEYQINQNLPRRFTLRGGWFRKGNKFGIRVRKASVQNLEAIVGTAAPWMRIQETGGMKKSSSGNKFFGIGVRARSAWTSKIRSPKYIKVLSEEAKKKEGAKNFWRSKKGQAPKLYGVYARGIRVEYQMARTAKIKKQWGFAQTTQALVSRRFDAIFAREFAKEMTRAKRTAKKS